ncbi:zinc metalloprotease [Miltoncostaea marina]|uniref:zinc metalloprotease n=1 Tax=Miltoncostaea marina TaxID=2843215 RepID=UPI001C3CBEAE|nr:zinc metalloprotease [Miltoncostaea marina]
MVRTCGTERVHERLMREVPGYAERRAAVENHAWRSARAPSAARAGCTRIPVVVHVVSRVAAEDIGMAQIESQIAVLNADFRRRNADRTLVPAAFMPVAADARIEFELASADPSGAPTDGVTRTTTTVNGFTDDDAVKSAGTGGADAWPADRYLNVWVCRLAGGLLGYAQFPGGPAETDGVVVTHTAFGTTGTAAAPFNLGRTATHEIGHWLNLRHIWGDDGTGCSGDDFVADTPNQAGPNTGTPTFPVVTCGNGPDGDMFMNYMDYTDDVAMFLFTAGQVTRMQAALDGPRSAIGRSVACGTKLKFTDEPVTLKFRDDPIDTLKRADDPIATIAKFRDDPVGTVNKFRDDPVGTAVKFRDDPVGTAAKFLDDGGTDPRIDPIKQPALDKPPIADLAKAPAADLGGIPDPGGPVQQPDLGRGGPAPFVLATPHHSMAWAGGEAGLGEYEVALAQYEEVIAQYARAEAAGGLGEEDARAARELYDEYSRLGEEYRRLAGR